MTNKYDDVGLALLLTLLHWFRRLLERRTREAGRQLVDGHSLRVEVPPVAAHRQSRRPRRLRCPGRVQHRQHRLLETLLY